ERVMRSLLIVVSVDVCGWIITPAINGFFRILQLNCQQMFAWQLFSKIFINVALSAKLFIYYSTSTDYRAAINAF
ncbi:hypothetical protein PMAYCL1PPCAC_15823, partial [Pristionchus mayeri]